MEDAVAAIVGALGVVGGVAVIVFVVLILVLSLLMPLFVWRIAAHSKETARWCRLMAAQARGASARDPVPANIGAHNRRSPAPPTTRFGPGQLAIGKPCEECMTGP